MKPRLCSVSMGFVFKLAIALFDQANENLDHVAKKIDKERRAAINEFEIFRDSGTRAWHVVGAGLQRFVQMTNWRYELNYSQNSCNLTNQVSLTNVDVICVWIGTWIQTKGFNMYLMLVV